MIKLFMNIVKRINYKYIELKFIQIFKYLNKYL